MSFRVSLRDEKASDFELVQRIYMTTRWEECQQTGWPPEQIETFLRQQFEAQSNAWKEAYPDVERKVIQVAGKDCGRLYVDRWPNEIRIVDIALLPEVRGKGVGEKLIRKIFREGEKSDRKVSIHVEQMNRARNLYLRLGFEKAGSHGIYDLMVWEPSSIQSE